MKYVVPSVDLNFNQTQLVKKIRSSKDIGLFGVKGVGKTTILSMIGFIRWYFNDVDVYSNIPLSYPYYFIESLEDFDEICVDGRNKIFIGDDFDYWFESRGYSSKVNKQLNEILMFFGKKSTSLVYSAKREMAIDKSLRESTVEFWELELCQRVVHPDPVKNRLLKQYMNFLFVLVNRYDRNLAELPSYRIQNLHQICQLFDTRHMISKINNPTT